MQIFVVDSENACVLKQSAKWPSRSSKVVDFGTYRKHVCDFLLVINSNFGPILARFRDVAGFLQTRATPPPYSTRILGVFHLD